MSPTLDVNVTLFVITMLQFFLTTQQFFIQISIIHDSISTRNYHDAQYPKLCINN